jgi:hypothetical protein
MLMIPAIVELVYLGTLGVVNHLSYITLLGYVGAVIHPAFLYGLTGICGVWYISHILQQTYYFVRRHWGMLIILWLFYVFFLLGVGIAMLIYLILQMREQFTWQISLPYQTWAIVWGEYASLAVFFLPQMTGRFRMKHILYLAALMGCFIFPLFYSRQSEKMRLHHSFYGLILMALPVRCLQWLGTFVCLDSLMYMWLPERGYYNGDTFVSYDCINILWENLRLVYTLYLLYACVQICTK